MRTVSEHRKFLEDLANQLPNQAAGFFGPGSMAWQLNREVVLGLVVLRALFMQLAHPKVALGVAEHSDFHTKPLGRAIATFHAQQKIVFGSADESIAALMQIYARHTVVKGGEGEESYKANDPALLFWVYATLIDSIRYAYRTFLPPLSIREWNQFYEEGKLFGKLIGIQEELIPRSWAEFDHWMDGMLKDQIKVSPLGREVGESLLRMPVRLAKPLTEFLAAGTLPPTLRSGFELAWTPRRQRLFDLLAKVIRFFSGHLPQVLHTTLIYWSAMRRVDSA